MILDYWRIIPLYKKYGISDRSKVFILLKFNFFIFIVSVEKNISLIIKCTRAITPIS